MGGAGARLQLLPARPAPPQSPREQSPGTRCRAGFCTQPGSSVRSPAPIGGKEDVCQQPRCLLPVGCWASCGALDAVLCPSGWWAPGEAFPAPGTCRGWAEIPQHLATRKLEAGSIPRVGLGRGLRSPSHLPVPRGRSLNFPRASNPTAGIEGLQQIKSGYSNSSSHSFNKHLMNAWLCGIHCARCWA